MPVVSLRLWVVASASVGLLGCASMRPDAIPPEPAAPVYPVPAAAAPAATGSIFAQRQGDGLVPRGRRFEVGDVLTVLLNESTQAARQQSANVSRESENNALPSGLTGRVAGLSGALTGINLNGSTIESTGAGQAAQRGSLTGSITVTVVEVMSNGNLVLQGEKQMALTEGSEWIQVSGVVRAQDVAPNNTVQSRRLANAQFVYKSAGDMATAARPGWGTRALLRWWPF
jgi:flagellar L-ring protein FlgH